MVSRLEAELAEREAAGDVAGWSDVIARRVLGCRFAFLPHSLTVSRDWYERLLRHARERYGVGPQEAGESFCVCRIPIYARD
jgi:hypothetical protein